MMKNQNIETIDIEQNTNRINSSDHKEINIHEDVIKNQRFLKNKNKNNSEISFKSKVFIFIFSIILPSLFYSFHLFGFNDTQCYSILFGICGGVGFIATIILFLKIKSKGERFWFFLSLLTFSYIIYLSLNNLKLI